MRFAIVLLTMASAGVSIRAEDPCVSGLKPGQRPGPYSSIVSTGPERGQPFCYICETEDKPAVVVFARSLNAPLGKFVQQLDKEVVARKSDNLCAWVTFLNDDQTRFDPKVVGFAKDYNIGHVPLGVFEDPVGPPTYRLNKDADLTILLFVKQKVVANFAFRAGEFDEKKAGEVLKALPQILPALQPAEKPPAQKPPADWAKDEAKHLTNVKQVTHDFVRAGEGYFSPDGKRIIFQAEEKDTGNPFYQIFVMELDTGKVRRVSPGIGKTTCAYFRPDGQKIIFASSHLDPDAKKKQAAEYAQREEDRKKGIRRRYAWDFDEHMDIFEANPDGTGLKRLTDAKGYDAEGSYSADGKQIVFTSNRSGPENIELYIMDTDGKNVRKLTDAPKCYNGGP
ncbi:MAG: TolB family protein, partial [Gemmataceae bacterium]